VTTPDVPTNKKRSQGHGAPGDVSIRAHKNSTILFQSVSLQCIDSELVWKRMILLRAASLKDQEMTVSGALADFGSQPTLADSSFAAQEDEAPRVIV
jgi:hypothetical protein